MAAKSIRTFKIKCTGNDVERQVDAVEMRESPHFLDFVNADDVTVLRIRYDLVETVTTDPGVTIAPDGAVEITT